jgi:hypothetical protein
MQHIGAMGGVFAILAFWHFIADWCFQSHAMAVVKSSNELVRLKHCIVYALLFWPLFLGMGLQGNIVAIITMILFLSHYMIDSYEPVAFWARYLRRAPEALNAKQGTGHKFLLKMGETPLGTVLIVGMDQVFHVAFLLPIAWLMCQ